MPKKEFALLGICKIWIVYFMVQYDALLRYMGYVDAGTWLTHGQQ
jgi:hypothetical protein